jgi:hypothetical protein
MIVRSVTRGLSATSLGLFVGAMLTEGFVLVPYWRALPPAEFLAWYAANDRRLLGFFGPLTTVTALLAVAAAVDSFRQRPPRWPVLLAAGLMVAVVSMFFLYFERANASFASASIRAEDVAAELTRWSRWHWWRTALAFTALVAAIRSLWQQAAET